MKGDRSRPQHHHHHGTAAGASTEASSSAALASAIPTSSSTLSPKFLTFQRRTTPLDWRRIASLDLEKIVHEGDSSSLEELTNPILYCKAEIEFERDDQHIDPGFIKVFRLAQLIGEYLQFRLRQSENMLNESQQRIKILESEKKKLTGETMHLRDYLTLTKKELRRRKELLESSTPGGRIHVDSSPLDEYHQCPYCVKRFLISMYLYAHIQRRHQGLPMIPMFSSGAPHAVLQNQNQTSTGSMFPLNSHGGMGGPASILNTYNNHNSCLSPVGMNLQRRDSFTQTPAGDGKSSSPVPPPREGTLSGRSEGEVRHVANEASGDGNAVIIPGATSIGNDGFPVNNNTKSSSSDVMMTVIKSPPVWNNGHKSGTNEEDGEVPLDENDNDQPLQSSSAEDILLFPSNSRPSSEVKKVSPEIVPVGPHPTPSTTSSRLDIKTICSLIETYLEQKSVPSRNQHYHKIVRALEEASAGEHDGRAQGDKKETSSFGNMKNSSQGKNKEGDLLFFSSPSTEGQFTKSDKLFLSRAEQVEKDVMRMKDEFESQWRDLSERVRNAGIQNLQGTLLLSEIKKVQDILNSPSRPISRNDNNHQVNDEEGSAKHANDKEQKKPEQISVSASAVPPENPLHLVKEVVEEQFQKQTMDLQQLKSNLEMKMESELQKMKACLEEQSEFWRQQIVQQSKGVTNLHETSSMSLLDESKKKFPPVVEKTSMKMQMGSLEGISSSTSKSPMPIIIDQSKVLSSNDSAEKTFHESNMTSHHRDDDYDDTNKAAEAVVASESVNELSHHQASSPSVPRKHGGDDDDDHDDAILIPIPKPRKQPTTTILTAPAAIRSNLISREEEIYKNDEYDNMRRFARNEDEFGHEITEDKIRYVTHERKHESAVAGESSSSKGKKEQQLTPDRVVKVVESGKINHVKKEMQNELEVDATGRRRIPGDRMKYLDFVAENSRAKNEFTKSVLPKSQSLLLDGTRTSRRQKSETDDDDDIQKKLEDNLSNYSASSPSQFTLLSYEDKKKVGTGDKPESKLKVVFDEKQGKLVEEAWKKNVTEEGDGTSTDDTDDDSSHVTSTVVRNFGESQLDLVRKKTLKEVDEELENIGINPEASSISLGEMSRALRLLKGSRSKGSSLEERENFRSEVLGNLNHEMTKKSIHQKLEEHSAGGGRVSVSSSGIGTSPLAKMLHKVKKSGNSWKKKVAFAMRRKQNSPTSPRKNKLQHALATTAVAGAASGTTSNNSSSEVRTSFFSKSHWVRTKGNKEKGSSSNKKKKNDLVESEVAVEQKENISSNESSSEEEESSSMDIEMPQFLTKSKPISSPAEHDEDEKESTKGNRFLKRNVVVEKHDNDKTMSRLLVSPNMQQRNSKIKKDELKNTKSDPDINNKQSIPRVVDDGSKWKNDYYGSTSSPTSNLHLVPSLFSAKSNGGTLNNNKNKSIIPSSSSKDAINNVKCPNFFVKESPIKRDSTKGATTTGNHSTTNSSRTFPRVTSNGWSSSGGKAPTAVFQENLQKAQPHQSKSMKDLSTKNSQQQQEQKQTATNQNKKPVDNKNCKPSPTDLHSPTSVRGKTMNAGGDDNRKSIGSKAWKEDFLAQLSPTSSSSSSSEFDSDSEDASSTTPHYSQTKTRQGNENNKTDGKFARNESNRVAFRKRHPNNSNTSLSDEDDLEEDNPHVVQSKISRNSKGKGVTGAAANGNSSDTSIWEDVDDEQDDDELGESESRDLPPPVQRSSKEVSSRKSSSNHKIQHGGVAEKVTKIAAGSNGKRNTSRSPGENSWDS